MIFNQIAMQGPFGDPAGDKRRMEKEIISAANQRFLLNSGSAC
jgi:hypothetical protein